MVLLATHWYSNGSGLQWTIMENTAKRCKIRGLPLYGMEAEPRNALFGTQDAYLKAQTFVTSTVTPKESSLTQKLRR